MADADFPKPRTAAASAAFLLEPAGKDIPTRLRAVVDAIAGRIIFTTSFGIEDQLVAHYIFSEKLPISVITLDTGRLFPETYDVWQQTEERYGYRIGAVYPDAKALATLVSDQGINGFYYSKDARRACCAIRKVEPLRRALAGAAGWITGLRNDQTAVRAEVSFAQWDSVHDLVKVSPLFDFGSDEVASECKALGVPVNKLHAQGFASIGCAPCTRAIRAGEPERAGRWWWEEGEAKECGLHLDASGRLIGSAAR